MEAWLKAGRRIKADWASMLDAMRSRSAEPAKLPFVPVRVSGRALEMVVRDALGALLGPNPSLLTVISREGEIVKAYAEDASGGIYEGLVKLSFEPGAGREALLRLAREEGVEVGVVKEADARLFDLFEEEPEDLLDALTLLLYAVPLALREGWLRFDPGLAFAEWAKALRLGRERLRFLLSRALPGGRYGLGFSCSGGVCALVVEFTEEAWRAEEVDVTAQAPGALARELVEKKGCGAALAVRVPDFGAFLEGKLTTAELLRGRGESWDLCTRSGLEGLLGAACWAGKLLALGRDLEECNVSLETILKLAREYLESARRYASEKGVGVKVLDGDESVDLVWDSGGVSELETAEPIKLDLALVRSGASVLVRDPLEVVRRFVPREVMDDVSYATAVVLVECERPGGRLLLFGGPHQFFNRAWEGDSCGVFLDGDGDGKALVDELPSKALSIQEGGRRTVFRGERMDVELRFERVRSRTDPHGAGRFLGEGKLARWAPGLEVERSLHRLASGRAELDGEEIPLGWGWMYLERGRGRLLRWPFGSTWDYSSWLLPAGTCGSGVHAAPMLGDSTPAWWRRLIEEAVDGAMTLAPDGDGAASYEPAVEPGPPARVLRDSALAGELSLRYSVLSAAVVPFDEEGQVIFRLRCLCRDGAGLCEIPASLPGLRLQSERCEVSFSQDAVSFRAGGRELLSLQTGGRGFIMPYVTPEPGLLRRATRVLFGRK